MDPNLKKQVLRTFTYGLYAVSCANDRELAGKLGKSALQHPDKLANITFHPGPNGCPILEDALAWVACEVIHTAEAGDSTLIIAEVVDVGIQGEGQPLTMVEAGFRHAG